MQYTLFYTGLVSTPWTIGLKCLTTNETLFEFDVNKPSAKESRKLYDKIKQKLMAKYSSILN